MNENEGETRSLDEDVELDLPAVKAIVAGAGAGRAPAGAAPGRRRAAGSGPGPRSLYGVVLHGLSAGTRNTPAQLRCLDAFERAVAAYRAGALALRRAMDLLTLEQRIEAAAPEPGGGSAARELSDALFLSNRQALAFAGHVGLALLGEEPAGQVQSVLALGSRHETSRDRDAVSAQLCLSTTERLEQVLAGLPAEGAPAGDEVLRRTLQAVFTAWVHQMTWSSWSDTARRLGVDGLTLRLGNLALRGGEAHRGHDHLEVDPKLMQARRQDVVGCEVLGAVLWRNLRLLACFDARQDANPFDPAQVIFTHGPPGAGKTFAAHAHMRSFVELCGQRGTAAWALTHSTTDYASHYQNKTANELSALAARINGFPGPVVMYVADADNIFLSRRDQRLTAEQYQTLAVYLKMFDGTLIPRRGKFLAIMDANYIDGIDEATRSRLFDEIVELGRFERAEQFAELVRRGLCRGGAAPGIQEDSWQQVGRYILSSPLSNREVDHVVRKLRRGLDPPDEVIDAGFTEQASFRDAQIRGLSAAAIIGELEAYISTRASLEVGSAQSSGRRDMERFLDFLGAAGPARR